MTRLATCSKAARTDFVSVTSHSIAMAPPIAAALSCAAALSIATTACQSTPVVAIDTAYDVERMARIERAARTAGVTVVWINPPMRSKVENVRN